MECTVLYLAEWQFDLARHFVCIHMRYIFIYRRRGFVPPVRRGQDDDSGDGDR